MIFVRLLTIAILLTTARATLLQCYIAGVSETDCDKCMKDSVLKKYYISNYGKVNNDTFDKPFFISNETSDFRLNDDNKTADPSTSNETNDFTLMKILHLDNNADITDTWNTVLTTGTDILRVKFYNKLVNMYQNNHQFQPSEMIIFVKACYTAASTHYFYKESLIALNVLKDGEHFIELLQTTDYKSVDKMDVITWSVLLQTLKIDIMSLHMESNIYNIKEEEEKLSKKETELKILVNNGKYPSAYLLSYRGYFLNKNFDEEKKKNLDEVIEKITFNTEHPDFYLFSKYHHLVLSLSPKLNTTEKDVGIKNLENLLSGFEMPLLSAEDRLINYELIKLVKQRYSCLTSSENNYPNAIQSLYNEYYEKSYNDENISNKFKYNTMYNTLWSISQYFANLSNFTKVHNNSTIINEDVFHRIVIASTEIDSAEYKDRVKNVENAIAFLEDFINQKDYPDKNQISLADENACYDKEIKIMLAHKWLIELYDIVCNENFKIENIDYFNKKRQQNLNIAESMSNEKKNDENYKFPRDYHLEYLLLKHNSNLSQLKYINVNELILSDINGQESESFSDHQTTNHKLLKDFDKTSNKYINKIELFIYTFGLLMEDKSYFDATTALEIATSIPVITSKDHNFHIKAIELYGIMLVKGNSKINSELSKTLCEPNVDTNN